MDAGYHYAIGPSGRKELIIMKQRDEGFTLIELLIVIVILGILAAVVVFAVGGITDRGNDSACAADKKTLEVAVEAYYAYETRYPLTVGLLTYNNTTANAYKLLNSLPSGAALLTPQTTPGDVTASGNCAA
ncbi:MAG: type II secretion system protein [Ilumatobacteraceae bacterium]